MNQVGLWIRAFRLRTLPLAFSCTGMGCVLSYTAEDYQWAAAVLAVITTLILQILANLANDYGDSQHGVDNHHRLGPERLMQSGKVTRKAMRRMLFIFTTLSLVSGVALLLVSPAGWDARGGMFAAGIVAILAALTYTAGKKPYGYYGFGDFFVFLFFGFTAVCGTFFLITGGFQWNILLPASTMGFFSTAVLNINNMRDIANDAHNHKRTLAVILGSTGAKYYHTLLILLAFSAAILYTAIHYSGPLQLLFVFTIPLFMFSIYRVFATDNPKELDPELRKTAVYTLLFTVLFGVGMVAGMIPG